MSKENKIFQPKVIIGSITSFIVAAVGIIAVFFPSLLNLEKKHIADKEFSLQSPKSLNKLNEFLLKNINKPVQLSLTYCSMPTRAVVQDNNRNSKSMEWLENTYNNTDYANAKRFTTYYIDHFGDNPRTNPEEELDIVAEAKIVDIIEGGDHEFEGLNLEEGMISWSEKPGLYHTIKIPHSTNKGKKYIWTSTYGDNKCPRIMNIKGTFFVHEQEMGDAASDLYQPYAEYQAFYSIELEPLDKKDLEMRNY